MRRLLIRLLAALVLLAALLAGTAYVFLRQSLPQTSGDVVVSGISGPVDIVRDADAIPHIYASTKADAFFGLGYVHAQDRLWQMEFQRRIGHGRLSEIFGGATIPQDRFLRTVGFGRAAGSAWSHLPEDVKGLLNAYVAGINAFIAGHRGRQLPPEFTLLRFEPEPFSGEDVIVWVKMMAWDLSANYSLELMRHDIAGKVGQEQMRDLLPPYPVDGLNIVPDSPNIDPGESNGNAAINRPASAATMLSAAFGQALSTGPAFVQQLLLESGRVEALGSNNWVVDGTLTASGRPMLANDPHLSTHIPSTWYLAHMTAGDFDVIGATLPGAPAIAIGRNRFIAWGETNVAADVEDLYLERIDPSGRMAEFRGAPEPMEMIPETIQVKGAAPVQVDVRVTRHGPLVSDAINANNAESKANPKPQPIEPLAFRWTALDREDTTIIAFLKLNEARDWDDFTAALRDLVVPAQNFVYADVGGHIGYYAPGRLPVRANGDGSQPAAGWTGDAEWTGWVPFEELPHSFDPPQHFLVTANNRPMAADYPHLVALEFPEPYRAQRITDLLAPRTGLTPNDFREIQADTLSLHAQMLLPRLLKVVRADESRVRQAIALLQQWNFTANGDSAAAAIFQAWFAHLAPALVGDELGPAVSASYEGRFSYITRFVINVLAAGSSPWCDNVSTPAAETCEQTFTRALTDGLDEVSQKIGTDVTRWRWDAIHRAIFPHQGLDSVRLLRPLISRSVPHGGDWSTVNVGPVSATSRYDQLSVSGYRQIIDLSPANDSRFLDAVGQSGHQLAPHYDDFLADWQAVRHKPMRMERKDAEAGALGTLHLLPAR